jgi:xanthine dehydrogenase large subunit
VTGPCLQAALDRDDDMIITGKRHDFRIHYARHDAEGRIRAPDRFTHYVRCGWSADLSLGVADRAMLHADNAISAQRCA